MGSILTVEGSFDYYRSFISYWHVDIILNSGTLHISQYYCKYANVNQEANFQSCPLATCKAVLFFAGLMYEKWRHSLRVEWYSNRKFIIQPITRQTEIMFLSPPAHQAEPQIKQVECAFTLCIKLGEIHIYLLFAVIPQCCTHSAHKICESWAQVFIPPGFSSECHSSCSACSVQAEAVRRSKQRTFCPDFSSPKSWFASQSVR